MLNKQWQVPQFLFQITLLYGSNELLNVGSSVDERIRNDGYSSVQIEGHDGIIVASRIFS